MSKNEDPDKYSYSGSTIGFNTCETFSLRDVGKNVIIFRVDKAEYSINLVNNKKLLLKFAL